MLGKNPHANTNTKPGGGSYPEATPAMPYCQRVRGGGPPDSGSLPQQETGKGWYTNLNKFSLGSGGAFWPQPNVSNKQP